MQTFSIAGGISGPPNACSSGANHIDVFAVGPGNTVWRWSWDGTSWSLPAPLPGQGVIPAEGVCAAASGPDRVEVFAVADTRAPVWWRGNGTQWSAGAALQQVANLPAVPVAAVCSSPDNIDVFGAGAGNTPWWWHWNGSWWTAQGALPGGANIPAERLAAVSAAPGRLDVFAPGAGNHLWRWSKVDTGPWLLEDLGGDLPAEGVSAVSWGPNRIDVFAASRAPGNPLQHWWSDGGGFAGPETLGGSLGDGTVSAVSHAANRLDVFGIARDGRISHWEWNGEGWGGPDFVGDNIPAGDVSAVVRNPHHLDVFVAGGGNTLRHWPGGGLENATTQPWSNWPTNHVTNPVVGHLWPDNLDELVSIVQEAERLGRGVRAVGSSWSNSDVAVSPAYVVETDRLDRVLSDVLSTSLNGLGSTLRLVHVEAGIKLEALNQILDGMGLALKTMGGSSGQSLAGVVSTSAHGMDIDRGPIPDMVRAIHLVGPGGVQHWIEPSVGITTREALKSALGLSDANIHYDDDWFNSVLVSMGSMGIIYSLVVEVDPQYDLVNTCTAVGWPTMKARLKGSAGPSPFANNRGVQVVINPYPAGDGSRTCYLTTRAQATATDRSTGGGFGSALTWAISSTLLINLKNVRSEIANDVNGLTAMVQKPDQGPTQGWGHTIMGNPDPGPVRGLTVEVVFEALSTRYLDFIDSALEILRSAYYDEPGSLGYLGWISLRFQGRSRAYLSPHHGFSRTCTVEFAAAWRMPDVPGTDWPDTPVLLARIEAEARRFGAIQHWGMNDKLDASDVARAYPRLDTWRRVRWALTNGGTSTTFDNDFTHRCGLSDPPSPAKPTYATFLVQTGTPLVQAEDTNGDFLVADFDRDSVPDLYFIKRRNVGTNSIEVHVLSGASNYQQFTLHTGTPLVQAEDGNGDFFLGDFDRDGVPDLYFIKRRNVGTNSIEVHVLSGASNYQQFTVHTGTPLVQSEDGNGSFFVADFDRDGVDDLYFIKRRNVGTNSIELHVLSGASTYQQFTLHTGTPLVQAEDGNGDFLLADYNRDGVPDLFFIKRRNVGTSSIEVHVLKGSYP
jgi:hypothetical protein